MGRPGHVRRGRVGRRRHRDGGDALANECLDKTPLWRPTNSRQPLAQEIDEPPCKTMPTRPRVASRETRYVVVWWMSQTPYAAVFGNRIAAEAAARVRNALLITISGRGVEVDGVDDYYRRDPDDEPMPAAWRDRVGQVHVPWGRDGELAEAAT